MSGNDETVAMLGDQLDRMLAQAVDAKLLAASENGEASTALIETMEEFGLSLALVGEEAGGAGLSWTDVGGILETLGYHAAPLGLGEQILANRMLASAGLGLLDPAPALAAEVLMLDPVANTVSGVCTVPWGGSADYVLASATGQGGTFLCLLPASAGGKSPLSTIGRDPRCRFIFEGTGPLAISEVPVDADGPLRGLAVLRTAQIAGALSRILALSIDYGNTRVQFGRPIGRFQAVQHMIAELAAEAAAAKAAVQFALRALDGGDAERAVAVAKIRASVAAGKGALLAHEVHGAIGVTEEHMLHYFTRRLWQWRDDAGNEHFWSERLGRSMILGGGKQLWENLVGIAGR